MILKHYYRSAVLHWWKLSLIQRKSSANYLYNCAEDDTITDISLELLHYWSLQLILRLLLFKFVLGWNMKEKKFSDSFLDNKQKKRKPEIHFETIILRNFYKLWEKKLIWLFFWKQTNYFGHEEEKILFRTRFRWKKKFVPRFVFIGSFVSEEILAKGELGS